MRAALKAPKLATYPAAACGASCGYHAAGGKAWQACHADPNHQHLGMPYFRAVPDGDECPYCGKVVRGGTTAREQHLDNDHNPTSVYTRGVNHVQVQQRRPTAFHLHHAGHPLLGGRAPRVWGVPVTATARSVLLDLVAATAADPVVRSYGAAQRVARAARKAQRARVSADDGEGLVLLPSKHGAATGAGAGAAAWAEANAQAQANMAELHGGRDGERVRVAYDGTTYPDTLSADAEATIDEAAAEDLLHVLAAVAADYEAAVSVGSGGPWVMRPCTNIPRLAHQLWEVSRWDLPVAARLELARWQAKYGEDAGWERYAAGLGVAP